MSKGNLNRFLRNRTQQKLFEKHLKEGIEKQLDKLETQEEKEAYLSKFIGYIDTDSFKEDNKNER